MMEPWTKGHQQVFNAAFLWFRLDHFQCGLCSRSTELDLLYPDLKEYIADMNVMMALIINGPV